MARNHSFEIRLTRDEKEKIEKKAIMLGLTVSGFIRMVALNSRVEVVPTNQ